MKSFAAYLLALTALVLAPLHGQQVASQPTPTAAPAPFDWVAAVQPETEWHRQPIGQGVFMWSRRFAGPDGKPQSITVVQARLDPPMVRLDVVAGDADGTPDKHPTSWFGEQEVGSVTAINGGFFHVPTGRSLGLLRVDETTVHPVEKQKGLRACLGITPSGALRFAQQELGDEWAGMEDALQAGPMLVLGGVAQEGKGGFWKLRHPRSAIGITAQNDAVMVVVDGRTEQAVGMSLDELAQVMLALGCVDAMNLDGGGSSALWARTHGVVSHPCDNKAFDHAGERKVANAIVLRAPLIRVLEVQDARRSPEEGWRRAAVKEALNGDGMAPPSDQVATMKWRLGFPAGRYEVCLRANRRSPRGRISVSDGGAPNLFDGSLGSWATGCYHNAPPGWTWESLAEVTLSVPGPRTIEVRSGVPDGWIVDAVRLRWVGPVPERKQPGKR